MSMPVGLHLPRRTGDLAPPFTQTWLGPWVTRRDRSCPPPWRLSSSDLSSGLDVTTVAARVVRPVARAGEATVGALAPVVSPLSHLPVVRRLPIAPVAETLAGEGLREPALTAKPVAPPPLTAQSPPATSRARHRHHADGAGRRPSSTGTCLRTVEGRPGCPGRLDAPRRRCPHAAGRSRWGACACAHDSERGKLLCDNGYGTPVLDPCAAATGIRAGFRTALPLYRRPCGGTGQPT